jgi:hypothetical protein
LELNSPTYKKRERKKKRQQLGKRASKREREQ